MDSDQIQNFIEGKTNPEETRKILEWLKTEASKPVLDAYYRNVWKQKADYHEDNYLPEEVLARINREIETNLQPTIKSESLSYHYFTRIAATIVILFTFYVALIQIHNSSADQKDITESKAARSFVKMTKPGQKKTFLLPDQSNVQLNASSSLEYFENDTCRMVSLSGEAFFEVSENKKRPFTVITGHISTTALGTAFNVKYHSHKTIEVALVNGKVLVKNDKNDSVVLKPGELAVAKAADSTLSTEKWDYLRDFSWKDGIIHFQHAPFPEIQQRLEIWFGIEFEVPSDFNSKHYTGTFEKESLDNILQSLSFIYNFDYYIRNNKVIIYKK